jgi:hypothetical protein
LPSDFDFDWVSSLRVLRNHWFSRLKMGSTTKQGKHSHFQDLSSPQTCRLQMFLCTKRTSCLKYWKSSRKTTRNSSNLEGLNSVLTIVSRKDQLASCSCLC